MKKIMLLMLLLSLPVMAQRTVKDALDSAYKRTDAKLFGLWVIKDTLHNDYYARKGWTKEKQQALTFRYKDALEILIDLRINEKGEYSNTGGKDYPMIVEPYKN